VSDELVGTRQEARITIVTLQRADKLNALSTAMEEELLAALSIELVRESRCVVFVGAGKAFSAGADVNEFREADPSSIAAYYAASGDVYERIAALPMPTIAAIHGWCLGGGLELALKAKELMLLSRRYEAQEARSLGLVTEVVPRGDALKRALEIGHELAALPPLALRTTKRAADAMAEASREAGILIERLAYAALAQTPEAKGAVEEFTRRDRRP
jgi:enoyl-CoA hydratase/carnithine racemase